MSGPLGPVGAMMEAAKLAEEPLGKLWSVTITVLSDRFVISGRIDHGSWEDVHSHILMMRDFVVLPRTLVDAVRHLIKKIDRTVEVEG